MFEAKKTPRHSTKMSKPEPLKQVNGTSDTYHKENHYNQITQRVNELTGQLEKLDDVVISQQEEIRSYRQDECTHREQIQLLNSTIMQKNSDLDFLSSQFQELSEKLENNDSTLQTENDLLQQQILHLQEQFKKQVDALENKINYIIKENDRLQSGTRHQSSADSIRACILAIQSPIEEQNVALWKHQNIQLKEQLSYLLKEFEVLKQVYDSLNMKDIMACDEKCLNNGELINLKSCLNQETLMNVQLRSENTLLMEANQQLSFNLQQHLITLSSYQKSADLSNKQIEEISDLLTKKQEVVDQLKDYGECITNQLNSQLTLVKSLTEQVYKSTTKVELLERQNKYTMKSYNTHRNDRVTKISELDCRTKEVVKNLEESDAIKKQLLNILKQMENQI